MCAEANANKTFLMVLSIVFSPQKKIAEGCNVLVKFWFRCGQDQWQWQDQYLQEGLDELKV